VGRFGKILILGAGGYSFSDETTRVFSFGWEDLGSIKNLRDYDVLILDLLGSPPKEWQRFYDLLDAAVMMDILRSGEILVLGDPRFQVETSLHGGGKVRRPFLEWTTGQFNWHNRHGDTVEILDDPHFRQYQPYLKHLKHWDYALDSVWVNREQLGFAANLGALELFGERVGLHKITLAQNRYSKDLAFLIKLVLASPAGLSREISGPVVFLPKTGLGEQDSLLLLLKSLYGVEIGASAPSWLSHYQAPGQEMIDKRIGQIEKQLKELRENLANAQSERAEARKYLKLLYERGKPLEDVARDALRELGATVETPKEEGKEDGWITVKIGTKTLEGVLEIKSTSSEQFDIAGFRQLLEWVQRGIELRHKKYKAIFIGNSSIESPVDNRPPAFSSSWQKSAELGSVAALKSEDIYYAYELKALGKLDVTAFWENLFATDGIFDRSKIRSLPDGSSVASSDEVQA
jgi:hypothetical protein